MLNLARIFVLIALPGLLLPLPLHASKMSKTKTMGEPRPDKALVYVVREKAFVGGGVGMFIFADEQLIAFVRNSTYGFGYVDPGARLVWGDTPSGIDVTFVAGETYYVSVKPTNPIVLLMEAEAKKAIEGVASYIESDQTDLDNAAKKVAKKYEKVQKREARKEKAEVEQVAVAAPMATEGMIRLPKNTRLAVELMENVSSALSTLGDTVWFRVSAPAMAGGSTLVPAGSRVKATVRQVKSGGSYGVQGSLDIALVSVDLADGTRVPLIGQLAAAGEARAAGVMTGIVAGAFIKGTEAFYPAGTAFTAWTGDEVWLRPVSESAAAEEHRGVTTAVRELAMGANTRRALPPVGLAFPCDGEWREVQFVSAGDWQLAEPLTSSSVQKSAGTCTATFPGWSLYRHVRASETPIPLHFHGRSGESIVHIDIPARMKFEF